MTRTTPVPAPAEELERALFELRRVVVGQDRLLERLLVALLARGHCLLEGVPGVAKTLAVETLARTVGGTFSRLQFTPDLVPSDIVGTRIFKPGADRFDVELGPVFANLAIAAVAAVGFLAAGTGNRLGAHVLHAGGVRRLPARGGRPALLGLLRSLLAEPRTPPGAGPGPPLAEAIDALDRRQRRRGLRVVVSDFLDPVDRAGRAGTAGPAGGDREPDWERPLRRLAARHQVLAVEVVDPRELDLPDVGLLAVVDPETGRRREVWTGRRALRSRYAAAAAGHRLAVRTSLHRAGADHLVLRTDRDWVRDVARFATDQRRRARARRRPFPTRSVS